MSAVQLEDSRVRLGRQLWQLRRRSHSSTPRSGAVLVAVLACILVAVALVGGALKSTLTSRRQCKLELQMQQAELLLQAGVDRMGSIDLATIESGATPLSSWDARAALPEFAIAEVHYQRVGTADAKPVIRCTVRLGVSDSPELAIQLSRDLFLNEIAESNSDVPQ